MGNISLDRVKRLASRLAGIFLERRWLLLVLLSLSAVIFEIHEHREVNNPIDAHFIREIIFFAIIYPLGVGILLNILLHIQAKQNALQRQREIEQKLNQEILLVYNWEELRLRIIHFLAAILPATGVSLFSFSGENHNLTFESEWRLVTAEAGREAQSLPSDHCGVANHALTRHLHIFAPHKRSLPVSAKGYCLPLFHEDRWVGVIYLYLPLSESLTTEQINTLNHISPSIALAIQSAMSSNPIALQVEAIQNERKRIARHLHDTLGQNLAYLRLMLDKMTTQGTLQEIHTIQKELERMQQVASEAHEQIRDTLIKLRPEGEVQLSDWLISQAEEAAKESGFVLNHAVTGEPFMLPFTEQRKIHAILREAIMNVRRHARAKQVQLSVRYDAAESSLTILLSDDGAGFIPNGDPEQGHFGLLIMRQRAEEIGGRLTIDSEPGRGTRVELRWAAK